MNAPSHDATRRALLASISGTALTSAIGAWAKAPSEPTDFPSRPVTLISPYSAGGTADVLFRPIAERLGRIWNQPVIIDTRSGANGIVATQYVARARPDGYTILINLTGIIQNLSLYKNIGYDPYKDLIALTQVGTQAMGLAVSANSEFQTFESLEKAIRQRPADFSYGSFGAGSTGHIYGELLRNQMDVALPHAPYRGEGPMLPDIMSGRVSYGFVSAYTALSRSRDRTLRILAVTGNQRFALMPTVPTLAERGHPNFDLVGWFGLFVPAGTPPGVAAKIVDDVRSVLSQPDVVARMRDLVIEPTGTTSAEFVALMHREQTRWDALIRKFNITLD